MHSQGTRRLDGWCADGIGRVTVLVVLVGSLGLWPSAQAAKFACLAGDIACLIAAINDANATPEEDTIKLEAGVYTLTAVLEPFPALNGLPTVTGALTIWGAVNAGLDWLAGGIGNEPSGLLTITESTLSGNGSFSGGRALANSGTAIIRRRTIVGNGSAVFGAGGLLNGGTLVLTNSTVGDNGNTVSLQNGPGALENSGTAILTSSTMSGNMSVRSTGGVSTQSTGTVTLYKTILVGNISHSTKLCGEVCHRSAKAS